MRAKTQASFFSRGLFNAKFLLIISW